MVAIDTVYARLRGAPDGVGYLLSVLWRLDPEPPADPAPARLQRDVAEIVVDIAVHWPQRAMFAGVRLLERQGQVRLEHDDTYVRAMVSALGDRGDPQPRRAAIRADEELRTALLWRVFEVEGGRRLQQVHALGDPRGGRVARPGGLHCGLAAGRRARNGPARRATRGPVGRRAAGTERAYSASAVLDALAVHPGRLGPLAAGVLAAGLTAGEPGPRTHAAEAFAALLPSRRRGPALLAGAMVTLARHATASRWSSSLRAAGAPGAVADVLSRALPRLPRDHPGRHALLATLHEESVRARRRPGPGAAPVAGGLHRHVERGGNGPRPAGGARMSEVEQVYRYRRPSTVDGDGLRLATSGGPAPHPYFYHGFVALAEPVAAALLVVARIARTRFYTPPSMLAEAIRAADPVVTADAGGHLRFGALSACCGVYASCRWTRSSTSPASARMRDARDLVVELTAGGAAVHSGGTRYAVRDTRTASGAHASGSPGTASAAGPASTSWPCASRVRAARPSRRWTRR